MMILVSQEAQDDLDSIWQYTYRKWSELQADLYIDLITIRMVWLTENEGLWHKRPDIKAGVFSYDVKSHVLFFSQRKHALHILRILHRRMDPENNI